MSLSRVQQAKLAAEIEQSRPTPEWDSIPELKKWREKIRQKDNRDRTMSFDELVVRYKELKAEMDFREAQLKPIKTALSAAMLVSGEEKVVCEGYNVTLVTKSGSRKISAEKLLAAGVKADTIAACTEIGDESQYVMIKAAKEDRA